MVLIVTDDYAVLAQVGSLAQFPEYDLLIRFISKAGDSKSLTIPCICQFFLYNGYQLEVNKSELAIVGDPARG